MSLAAVEETASLGEICQGLHWESRHAVVGSLGVVDFVDRNSGVHNFWLNSLLVDDWLDGLVNMVVDVFTGDRWS